MNQHRILTFRNTEFGHYNEPNDDLLRSIYINIDQKYSWLITNHRIYSNCLDIELNIRSNYYHLYFSFREGNINECVSIKGIRVMVVPVETYGGIELAAIKLYYLKEDGTCSNFEINVETLEINNRLSPLFIIDMESAIFAINKILQEKFYQIIESRMPLLLYFQALNIRKKKSSSSEEKQKNTILLGTKSKIHWIKHICQF